MTKIGKTNAETNPNDKTENVQMAALFATRLRICSVFDPAQL
jgi:hypothetical protein